MLRLWLHFAGSSGSLDGALLLVLTMLTFGGYKWVSALAWHMKVVLTAMCTLSFGAEAGSSGWDLNQKMQVTSDKTDVT